MELDFYHEAQNSARVTENFRNSSHHLSVPQPVWELTTPKILTMEWIDGAKVTDKAYLKKIGADPKEVARRLAEVFYQQIYFHGFVHCDPHPGNIFVRKTNRDFEIVLLDNGIYKTYDDEFRLHYAKLWLAILKGNEQDIEYYSKSLGVKDYKLFSSMLTTRAWKSVTSNQLDSQLSPDEVTELREYAQGVAAGITNILAIIPSELLLLFKTNDMLRAVVNDLSAGVNTIGTNLRYCQKSVNEYELKANPGLWTRISAIQKTFFLNVRLFILGILLRLYSFFPRLG